jgi:hypothetical protein
MDASFDDPNNELELALVAGARDEAARPHFYEALLKAQVFIVPSGGAPLEVEGGIVQTTAQLDLATVQLNGAPHVPFFSSEARLPSGAAFLGMSAFDLLQITRGSHLVLNPGSAYGKAFLPGEVESLLDGSMFKPTETLTAKGGEQQLIGQPKDYPHKLAETVSRYLESEPDVEQAFLAQHFIAEMHTEPALLVAVVAPESGFERIAGAIGIIAKDTRAAPGAVDVTRLQPNSLGYFKGQQPIYQRKKKSLLTKLFG